MKKQGNKQFNKPRILIVDDAPEILHAMMAILGDSYAVIVATSGGKAMQLAAREPKPNLILLDIKMPGIGGYEVLRRLKVNPHTVNIPVIIVSDLPELDDEAKGFRLGAVDYISKPVNPDWLKLRVLTQLELRRYRRKPLLPLASTDVVHSEQFSILIVDHMPENIHQLISALNDEYCLMVADNGREAMDIVLGATPPDLVLLDMILPDMDGFDVCRRIKATETGNQIPVIFLSAVEDPLEKVRGFSLGAADFITKPFDIDEVCARVRNHLELGQLHRFFEQTVVHRTSALQKSNERFKTMFMQAPLGIALIDSLNGNHCEVNPRFAEIANRSMDQMLQLTWLQITHQDDLQADLDHMELLNAGKINGFQVEKRYVCPDGSNIWINMTVSPLNVEDKAHPRHLSMIEDITERKLVESRVKYLNRVYAMLSEINSLIVHVNDQDELFKQACQIAVALGEFRIAMLCRIDSDTGKIVPIASAGNETLITNIKDLLTSDKDVSQTLLARAFREKQAMVSNDSLNDPEVLFGKEYAQCGVSSMAVLPLIVADEAVGVIALYSSEIEFFHEEEMNLLVELANDISFAIDHIAKQEKLNYLAYYDELTGLANRSLFSERVAQHIRSAVRSGHKVALCLFDLERFKSINDSLGRQAGDELLRLAANWFADYAQDVNLLSRIDADHFAIVLPEIGQDGPSAYLIEKMGIAFNEHPFHLNNADFRIATKMGIALFPDDGANVDTLFKNAEAALKKAKLGSDRYLFYTQKMNAAVASKLMLENQLRQAIDNEEFVLHYQPKVNIASGKVNCAEALIRWNDPLTGLVPPAKFIPILEETGLIYEVGRWALRQAIADNLRWRKIGLPAIRVAVNVSALQLQRQDFIAEVEQAIAIDPRAAEGLELEITESMIMKDIEHNIASLNSLRAMGITIAIDDFGTGFSSLSYLSKLPVDTLKIDRSFVIEMTTGPKGLALVSTIITLAHAFKLNVIAEGVETQEQSNLLKTLDCDEIQGFLYSKAVPFKEFEARFLVC
jgi:diguanylate cyclase (GGDEF)-like protein/PAS domain S-box-containing protein